MQSGQNKGTLQVSRRDAQWNTRRVAYFERSGGVRGANLNEPRAPSPLSPSSRLQSQRERFEPERKHLSGKRISPQGSPSHVQPAFLSRRPAPAEAPLSYNQTMQNHQLARIGAVRPPYNPNEHDVLDGAFNAPRGAHGSDPRSHEHRQQLPLHDNGGGALLGRPDAGGGGGAFPWGRNGAGGGGDPFRDAHGRPVTNVSP